MLAVMQDMDMQLGRGMAAAPQVWRWTHLQKKLDRGGPYD